MVGLIGNFPDYGRDSIQPGLLGGSPPPLSGNNFILIVTGGTNNNRLHNTLGGN